MESTIENLASDLETAADLLGAPTLKTVAKLIRLQERDAEIGKAVCDAVKDGKVDVFHLASLFPNIVFKEAEKIPDSIFTLLGFLWDNRDQEIWREPIWVAPTDIWNLAERMGYAKLTSQNDSIFGTWKITDLGKEIYFRKFPGAQNSIDPFKAPEELLKMINDVPL